MPEMNTCIKKFLEICAWHFKILVFLFKLSFRPFADGLKALFFNLRAVVFRPISGIFRSHSNHLVEFTGFSSGEKSS